MKIGIVNPDIIDSFKCSTNYLSEEDDEINLYLLPYTDDFTTSHCTQSMTKKTKLTGQYFGIANLSYLFQCKRKDLFISSCVERKMLDRIKYGRFLKPFSDSVKEINLNPLTLTNGIKIRLVIGPLVADNLESNAFGGLSRGFGRGTHSCKWCLGGYDDFQVRDANTNYDERPETGSVFNDSPHTETRLAPDVFHDICCDGNLTF